MRTSSKSNYGLKAMLYLALNSGGGVIPLGEVAAAERIPIKFLEQVVLALKGKGLLESKRGASGGYRLAKDPQSITLRDVLEATEDSLLSLPREDDNESSCPGALEEVWAKLDAEVNEKYRSITLAQIVERAKELSESRSRDFVI